ncbi:MAG: hypothetical protein ABI212_06045 [Burkholderiaceae bacterium]
MDAVRSIGPSLLWAAFDGGARRAASDSARASYDQSVALYRQTMLTALQEVEENLAAAAARKAEKATLNQYQVDIVSFLNVLTAHLNLLH